MAGFTVQVRGLDRIRAFVRAFGPRARQAYRRGARGEGETIMTAAKRIVPVDSGALRATGHVEGPVTEGSLETMTLGFGSVAVQYAAVQHERLDFHHVPPGQAKYLEQPCLDAVPDLAARIADAMRGELEAGA